MYQDTRLHIFTLEHQGVEIHSFPHDKIITWRVITQHSFPQIYKIISGFLTTLKMEVESETSIIVTYCRWYLIYHRRYVVMLGAWLDYDETELHGCKRHTFSYLPWRWDLLTLPVLVESSNKPKMLVLFFSRSEPNYKCRCGPILPSYYFLIRLHSLSRHVFRKCI